MTIGSRGREYKKMKINLVPVIILLLQIIGCAAGLYFINDKNSLVQGIGYFCIIANSVFGLNGVKHIIS